MSSMIRVSEIKDGRLIVREIKDGRLSEIEEQLNIVQDKITEWELDPSPLRDCEAAPEYVEAVDDARKLTERLKSLCLSYENEVLQRARDVLHRGMVRLEQEFRHILVQFNQPFESPKISLSSSDGASFTDDSLDEVALRSISRNSEESIIDLVNPDVIPDLKCIAELMFGSNYVWECTDAFIRARKDAMADHLVTLGMENLRIEDPMNMERLAFVSKIRRWVRAIGTFVRVYLASEKWLCDQIFGDLNVTSSFCFVEASKASVSLFQNFGETIATGCHRPEDLFLQLEVYEALADLSPDIEALYPNETGFDVKSLCQDVIKRLHHCAKSTFLEFENFVASQTPTTPVRGGGIHPLTRYVMNYIMVLKDHSETLNTVPFSSELRPISEEDNAIGNSSCSLPPVALHFRSIISTLERRLHDMSKLYNDDSLRHFFLMNNIHYMAQKVNGSELRTMLGEGLYREQNRKFQQHAMNYERTTWSSILSLLMHEGIYNPGSNTISRKILKERLKGFNLAFDEVYKSQTGWVISDSVLQKDLRISASIKVVQAYRAFVGRFCFDTDKGIKYTADDLEIYLFDLFDGCPKSLPNDHKK